MSTDIRECNGCDWAGAHNGVDFYNYCPLCGEELE